jgi:hypothetical protein
MSSWSPGSSSPEERIPEREPWRVSRPSWANGVCRTASNACHSERSAISVPAPPHFIDPTADGATITPLREIAHGRFRWAVARQMQASVAGKSGPDRSCKEGGDIRLRAQRRYADTTGGDVALECGGGPACKPRPAGPFGASRANSWLSWPRSIARANSIGPIRIVSHPGRTNSGPSFRGEVLPVKKWSRRKTPESGHNP